MPRWRVRRAQWFAAASGLVTTRRHNWRNCSGSSRSTLKRRGGWWGSFAFEAADIQRIVGAFSGLRPFDVVDIALRVAIGNRQTRGGGMLSHEFAVLQTKGFAKTGRRVAAEV